MKSPKASRFVAVALCLVVVSMAMPAAWADENLQIDALSAQHSRPSVPLAGASCKKIGQKQGVLTCKKVKGKMVWVRNSATAITVPGASTTSVAGASTTPVGAVTLQQSLCSNATYTSQVSNLSCSAASVTFSANGLPGSGFTMMAGITATNQQYPRPHNYQYTFPRLPTASSSPTTPGAGAIGVAIDGIPLFSPWTQAAVLEHTKDVGELDVCGGHAGRGDDYHYHIAPTCLLDSLGEKHIEDLKLPVGIANDGNQILALGWFRKSNDVESKLDKCRGMSDTNGTYFYNIKTASKWDILTCFTNKVVNTSRDSWTSRYDSQGNLITGAKVAMTITNFSTEAASATSCYVMKGTLRNQQVIQTNQSVQTLSSPTAIFYCDPACYAEFFEPTNGFLPGSLYYELVTTKCPQGFNPATLPLLAGYAGANLGRRAAK